MTRTQMIDHLYVSLCSCKHWGEVREVMTECMEWNSNNPDQEIFMAEGVFNTVTIEDDYVAFNF